MASDIEQNIVIGVEGADAAVGDLNSLSEAMTDSAGASRVFAHSFEHFGAHEASIGLAEFVGVTGNARPLVMAMTQTMMAGAGAMGLTAGAVAPLVAALAAAGGIYLLVTHNSAKHRDELEKSLSAYMATVSSMDAYTAAGGRLSTALEKVYEDTKKNAQQDLNAIAAQNAAKLAADQHTLSIYQQQVAYQKSIQGIGNNSDALVAAQKAVEHLQEAVNKDTATVEANAHGYATLGDYVKSSTTNMTNHTEEVNKAAEAHQRLAKAQVEASLKFEEAMDKMRHDQLEYQINLDKMRQKSDTDFNAIEMAASKTFESMSSKIGQAFADMIVKGKSWHDAFISFSKDLESEFVAMVTQMIIKWAMFEALTGGGMSVAGASAFTGFAGHATGTDTYVDQPTPFIAGEAGMERVTVTPMGGSSGGAGAGGGGGGGSSPVNISVNVSAAGVVTDLNAFANIIGQKVIQQVRGQQQQQMVRSS